MDRPGPCSGGAILKTEINPVMDGSVSGSTALNDRAMKAPRLILNPARSLVGKEREAALLEERRFHW